MVLYLSFFLGSAHTDGVPMLHYSVPVLESTIEDVKVCHCSCRHELLDRVLSGH